MIIETAAARKDVELWQRSPAGRLAAAKAARFCRRQARAVAGQFAVQAGDAPRDFLAGATTPHCARLGLGENCDIRASGRALPFAADSVDLLILAHALEFCGDPHQALREAARVLRPGGSLIVLAFNSAGLLGLRARFERRGRWPWRGQFISPARLKDWLQLLGLAPVAGEAAVYLPPINGAEKESNGELKTARRKWSLAWMEKAGNRWWPMFCGVYFIRAEKRAIGARLIKPAWKKRRLPAAAALAGVRAKSLRRQAQGGAP